MHHFIKHQIRNVTSKGLNFVLKSSYVRQQHRHSSSASRKGFGSFHCEDVEVLIRQNDNVYVPPSIHSEIILKLKEKNDDIVGYFNCGRSAKKDLFLLGVAQPSSQLFDFNSC